jgi:hypothetical protein
VSSIATDFQLMFYREISRERLSQLAFDIIDRTGHFVKFLKDAGNFAPLTGSVRRNLKTLLLPKIIAVRFKGYLLSETIFKKNFFSPGLKF